MHWSKPDQHIQGHLHSGFYAALFTLYKKALPGALAVLSCRAYSLVGTDTVAPFPCLHNVL